MRPRRYSQAEIVAALVKAGLVPIAGGSGPCTPLGTLTPNLGLCLPADGEVGWTAAINQNNFMTIDGLFTTGQILKPANGGTGVNAATAVNGQLLIGQTGTGLVLGSITAGSGIIVTPGAGTVTIQTSGAPGGGSIVAAGVLMGDGSGDLATTAGTYVDADAVNLKATVTIPGAAKFIILQASFTIAASVIVDGLAHVQFFAAGIAAGQACFTDNNVTNPASTYSIYGVVANPPSGAQTIALQFRGDGANAFTIANRPVEGAFVVRPRLLYTVTN